MSSSAGLAHRVRALPGRIWPGLDERLWNRARDREVGPRPGPRDHAPPAAHRPSHVVIVPIDGPNVASWQPAGGNFFHEIVQAGVEYGGDARVSVFAVEPGEAADHWHERLIAYLVDSGATHLLAQVESDPNNPSAWTWDVLWSRLIPAWDGVFLGVMFDSAFRWLTIHSRRLARMSDRFVLVDICMPMDGVLVRGRPEIGPVNMPVSNQSVAVIERHVAGLDKAFDVSFIGALYPYRVDMIDALTARGLTVAVNPHRPDAPQDFAASRANQPTYLDYMAGLARSQMTINLSRSSAGDVQQLKTRVLEASLVGCLVLTDDVDRTERFWVPGEEYGYFAGLRDLPALVEAYLADSPRLARAQAAAQRRARTLNVLSFWGGIDDGLLRRRLPAIVES